MGRGEQTSNLRRGGNSIGHAEGRAKSCLR